jgi:hypothetical protein
VPLGLPELAAYGWRKRGGQQAFQLARKAEAAGDWSAVVTACQQALAADPGHLEASWLLAVGLAKLGKTDQVLLPLSRAAAGDFAKWGQASLELPALQAFLATPIGDAWRRHIEADRERFVTAIARSVIVSAEGELYAFSLGESPAVTAPAPQSHPASRGSPRDPFGDLPEGFEAQGALVTSVTQFAITCVSSCSVSLFSTLSIK